MKSVCKNPVSLFPVWEKNQKPHRTHLINGEILKDILLILKMRERYPLSVSIGQCTGSPSYSNKARKWNGWYKIDKEKRYDYSLTMWLCIPRILKTPHLNWN